MADGWDWLSYTTITPRASLQCDAKNVSFISLVLLRPLDPPPSLSCFGVTKGRAPQFDVMCEAICVACVSGRLKTDQLLSESEITAKIMMMMK